MELKVANDIHFRSRSEKVLFLPDTVRSTASKSKKTSCNHINIMSWIQTWRDFTEYTTLHGMRFIFMRRTFTFRRLLWLLLTLTCLGIMMYQIIDRVIYYNSNPSNVNVRINYNDSLIFPALTICNQNAFRATMAKTMGWYRLIEDIYGKSGEFSLDKLPNESFRNISMADLYTMTGHDKNDLIVRCFWGKEECSALNFTSTLTDHGLCYTFLAPEKIQSTGADHGLKLLLNVEQYEYMPGPHDAAGIKLLTHGPNELPRVRELGISVPTGSHSFVGLQIINIRNLPHPFGQCNEKKLIHFKEYSYDSCSMECQMKRLEEGCGCRDFYMPHVNDKPPVCTLEQYFTCYSKLKNTDHHSVNNECVCPTACSYFVYDPVLSYATTSQYASEKLKESINATALQKKLIQAREVTNRMKLSVFEDFREKVGAVQENVNDILDLIQNVIHIKLQRQKDYLEYKYNETVSMWAQHAFYLQYQLYNIRKNFMRGRDAMEERTLAHLCNSFHEFVHKVESSLRYLIDPNVTDSSSKRTFYMIGKISIHGKLETAQRALANYTQLYNAYKTGTPIFRYKFKKIHRNDNPYAVPITLMNESTYHNSYARKYTPRLESDITRMMESLDLYQELLDDVYETEYLNITTMNSVSEKFLDSCEDFYHAKSVMYFETIDRPERVLLEKITTFESVKANLDLSKSYLDTNLENLESSLQILITHCLEAFKNELTHSKEYFSSEQLTKQHLAEVFLSEKFHLDINNVTQFFHEIQNRGRNMYDGWTDLVDKINSVWNQSLSYEGLKDYYIYKNITKLLQNYTHVSKGVKNSVFFIRDSNDIQYAANTVDASFSESVKEVTSALQDYQNSIQVNHKLLKDNFLQLDLFYRQLSYEEIEQQKAYDIFALLCDIGGSMGLFVGASVMTVFELFDLVANFAVLKVIYKNHKSETKL